MRSEGALQAGRGVEGGQEAPGHQVVELAGVVVGRAQRVGGVGWDDGVVVADLGVVNDALGQPGPGGGDHDASRPGEGGHRSADLAGGRAQLGDHRRREVARVGPRIGEELERLVARLGDAEGP